MQRFEETKMELLFFAQEDVITTSGTYATNGSYTKNAASWETVKTDE